MKLDTLFNSFVKGATPVKQLNIAEWTWRNLSLPSQISARPGKISFKETPYQQQILEIISKKYITDVVIQSSAQVGKTNILLYIIAYFMKQEPCNILIVEPTETLAKSISTEKLAPLFRENKKLQEIIIDDNILQKSFMGGILHFASSKSPAELSSRTIRVVLQDELDSYDIGKEGNPADLADKRSQTFQHRAKRIKVSTPKKNKGESFIEKEIENSNLYHFFINCLDCGFSFTPLFKNLIWEKVETIDKETGEILKEHLPKTTKLKCPNCNKKHNEIELKQACRKGKFNLINPNPNKKKVGFWFWQIISPFSSMEEIIEQWIKLKDDAQGVRTFKNLVLGETYEENTVNFKLENLLALRSNYDELPNDVRLITAGVDCQRDRVEVEVVGWCEKEQSYQLDFKQIYGDVLEADIWAELDVYLSQSYKNKKIDCVLLIVGIQMKQHKKYMILSKVSNIEIFMLSKGVQTEWEKEATLYQCHQAI